nr:uncharacterized protein LOC129272049 [Lytechinus pictus]
MAYKFYHRFLKADFQRYREFFPKIEPEPSRDGVAMISGTSNPQSNVPLIKGCKTTDHSTRDTIKQCHELNIHQHHPHTSTEDDETTSPIPSPASSILSTTSSITTPSSPSYSSEISRSRRRKASRPRRSPKKNDPKFKGVAFSMVTVNSYGSQEPILKIKSKLSIRRYHRMLAKRSMGRWRHSFHRRFCFHGNSHNVGHAQSSSSSSETDSDVEFRLMKLKAFKSSRFGFAPPWPNVFVRSLRWSSNISCRVRRHSGRLPPHTIPDPLKAQGKTCESCKTARTPLWRDAEDGTPLCNACGIRYKKYRIRCPFCWLIPRKDSKTFPYCGRCGMLLKLVYQRKIQYL